MANFYGNLAIVAARLLRDKGQTATITRKVESAFNPATGAATLSPDLVFSGSGALFGYNRNEIDGAVITNADARLILEATAQRPQVGDVVAIGGRSYRVQNVRESSPGGTVTHYELQVRL